VPAWSRAHLNQDGRQLLREGARHSQRSGLHETWPGRSSRSLSITRPPPASKSHPCAAGAEPLSEPRSDKPYQERGAISCAGHVSQRPDALSGPRCRLHSPLTAQARQERQAANHRSNRNCNGRRMLRFGARTDIDWNRHYCDRRRDNLAPGRRRSRRIKSLNSRGGLWNCRSTCATD
jgi:hypothetical protein